MFEEGVLQRVAIAALAAFGWGCAANAKAKVKVDTAVAADDDRKYEVPEPSTPTPTSGFRPRAVPAPAPAPEPGTSFVGVVHDLSLSPGAPRTPACRCLAVAYGPPADARFVWQEGPPKVDPGTMAVAIAADGLACSDRGYAPLRASISAVERSGDDIVLVVENVREGLPTMHGALVFAPSGKGALVVRSRRGAPYGAPPAGGSGPCRVAVE